MYALYEQNQLNLAKGDFSLLADLHAMSCSLKVRHPFLLCCLFSD